MDFSFVGSSNSLKRKATREAEQPVPKSAIPVAPTTSQPQPAQTRSLVQLPSLQQVQAAQRAQPSLNVFQPSSGPSTLSQQPSAGHSGPQEWSTAHRPDVSLPRAASAAAQGSGASYPQPQAQQGSSFAYPVRPSIPGADPAGPSHQPSLSHQQAAMVNPNAIFVNKRQEGNPVLKHIRNVRWQFADIVPDYQMGQNACAVFLSLRFHLLKPDYVHHRIKELQRSFRLRLLVCHIDVEDVVEPLAQVIKAALLNEVTLICGWSPQECARYLETYKSYETKPADAIQGRTDEDYLSRLNSALTTVRGVNKTDVLTLGATFKTATSIMKASMEELAACPGLGPTKVKRLHDTFHEPFRKVVRQQRLPFAASQSGEVEAGSSQQLSQVADVTDKDATAAAAEVLLQDSVLESAVDDDGEELEGDLELDL
ncbi:hypothetical protein ABBQ38_007381 [Trebouxia sp. C0009 RCD-2024]